MYENLFVIAAQTNVAGPPDGSALSESLRISAIAMLAIFFVMGLFGGMISLFSILFPASEDETS